MNRWIVAGSFAFTLSLAQSPKALSFSTGPPVGRNGSVASGGPSVNCTNCHSGSLVPGLVEIIAPGSYAASQSYLIGVKVSDPTQVGAGFQLSVEDVGGNHVGTLSLVNPTNTQMASGWVHHTLAGVMDSISQWAANGQSVTYQVMWTAPGMDVGPITFYAAGNAIDFNGSSSGDRVSLHAKTAEFTNVPVPTISFWGSVAMLLLVVTAGTLVLKRRLPLEIE